MQKSTLGDPPLIKFMIKDTGVGIKADNLDELLKSSQKDEEKEGGNLGLGISREIAQKLGKGLQFIFQYGYGCNFWFFIEAFEIN
jgi:signal transduction histidine kinase